MQQRHERSSGEAGPSSAANERTNAAHTNVFGAALRSGQQPVKREDDGSHQDVPSDALLQNVFTHADASFDPSHIADLGSLPSELLSPQRSQPGAHALQQHAPLHPSQQGRDAAWPPPPTTQQQSQRPPPAAHSRAAAPFGASWTNTQSHLAYIHGAGSKPAGCGATLAAQARAGQSAPARGAQQAQTAARAHGAGAQAFAAAGNSPRERRSREQDQGSMQLQSGRLAHQRKVSTEDEQAQAAQEQVLSQERGTTAAGGAAAPAAAAVGGNNSSVFRCALAEAMRVAFQCMCACVLSQISFQVSSKRSWLVATAKRCAATVLVCPLCRTLSTPAMCCGTSSMRNAYSAARPHTASHFHGKSRSAARVCRHPAIAGRTHGFDAAPVPLCFQEPLESQQELRSLGEIGAMFPRAYQDIWQQDELANSMGGLCGRSQDMSLLDPGFPES